MYVPWKNYRIGYLKEFNTIIAFGPVTISRGKVFKDGTRVQYTISQQYKIGKTV